MSSLRSQVSAELAQVKSQLPIGRDPASKEARRRLFERFDPNSNGILSLAEVDKALTVTLQLGADSLSKPAINRAFHAARAAAPPVASFSNDYIDRNEFRYLLVYLRHYLELWKIFAKVDTSGDRRVRIEEFTAALPLMSSLGFRDAQAWSRDPASAFRKADRDGGGAILFDEFADFCLRGGLPALAGGEDPGERKDALAALQKKTNACSSSLLSMSATTGSFSGPKVGRKIDIDWSVVDQKLPVRKDAQSKAARDRLFAKFDPNGNGILSLAEVDLGLTKVLEIGGMKACKPAINRAFHAARQLVPPVADFSNDYIDKNEFRMMLVYLRKYLELWQLFNQVDASGDRHVRLNEFKAALPLFKQWGLKEVAAWQKDPEAGFREIDKDGGGIIRYQEFADFLLRSALRGADCSDGRRDALQAFQKNGQTQLSASLGSNGSLTSLRASPSNGRGSRGGGRGRMAQMGQAVLKRPQTPGGLSVTGSSVRGMRRVESAPAM